MFNNFLSIFGNEVSVGSVLVIALFLTIPLVLGFLFSLINSQTRFKKLGAILWIVLMVPILGISVLANWKGDPIFFGDIWRGNLVRAIFIADVPLFLCASWFGRFFDRKKKNHWLVFPVIYGFAVVLASLMFWAVEAKPLDAYQERLLSKDEIEKSEGYDFEIRSLRGSNYETALLRIRGKGDSVYYQVGYYLCPFVLDGDDKHAYGLGNGELSANYIDPLNKSVTSWILLGREKSSIAINLRTAMMSYENEMTIEQMVVLGPGVSAQIYDYNKGMHRSVNFFVKYISKFPKAKAISEMEDSLWPARETFTKYSYEQAEKACRESQNFTGE